MRANQIERRVDGFYRMAPDGYKYRCCEAMVEESPGSSDRRLCKRAASSGDRLCHTHAAKRSLVREGGHYVISVNKRGVVPTKGKGGYPKWPKFFIGKRFASEDDAHLWAALNSTLIFGVPKVKSFCVERVR